MPDFNEVRTRINVLGRAEYRYDRLVSEFAEHYMELNAVNYQPLPDFQVFQTWLRHLNFELRPALLAAWKEMAAFYGFEIGDRIVAEGTDFYVVRASSYPRENIVRFTGFAAKKDGKAGSSSATVAVKPDSKIEKKGQKLDAAFMEPIYFEGSTSMANIKDFLKKELAKLHN